MDNEVMKLIYVIRIIYSHPFHNEMYVEKKVTLELLNKLFCSCGPIQLSLTC